MIVNNEEETVKDMVHEQGAEKYREFLQEFLNNGYRFCFFDEIDDHKENAIILRHDIDFDCRLACRMAAIEKELNIKASYFFFVSGQGYDITTAENLGYINTIRDWGHAISLHFDPGAHVDLENGLKKELGQFEALFGFTPGIISLHKPKEYLQYDQSIAGKEHTYQSAYFRNIKYFSDSTGSWRFGHPFDSAAFRDKKNMQILVHPLWWLKAGNDLNALQ